MPEFIKQIRIQAPAGRIFAWHEQPDAIRKLIPPWERVEVLQPPEKLSDGALAILRMGRWPLRLRWFAEHRDYVNRGPLGGEFTDVQVRGPFKKWEHTHRVEPAGTDACVLTDHIQYELPLGSLGNTLGGRLVRRKLERMFAFRHRITIQDNQHPGENPK